MNHPEDVKRLFTKSDEEMLQQSDLQLSSFRQEKESFVIRFPKLADPFADEWARAIATARGQLPDYASATAQASETDVLENLMDEGRNLSQMVLLYARIAFPNNEMILQLFGQSRYDTDRNSHLRFPSLLQTMFAEVSKPDYKPVLMERGLKETDINRLYSLGHEIIHQNLAQQEAMKARSLAAYRRISLMNTVWEKMALVCQCAKLVFQNDIAKYNLFLLNGEEAPTTDDAPPPSEN